MADNYKIKYQEAQAQSDRNFARYEKRKAQSDRNFSRFEREKKKAIEKEKINEELKLLINELQTKLSNLKSQSKASKSSNTPDDRTSLTILGLSSGYTDKELKDSYNRLVNRYHPDKHVHMTASFITEAETEFKKIKSAYEKLK